MATTQLSDTPDVIQHIRPQVIRSLVDERLQTQAAKKAEITITDADINNAIADIEKGRGMEPGAIFHLLDDKQVPHATFINQIRAQLAWNKVVSKKIRPLIHVSDNEIEMTRKKAIRPDNKQELQIAALILPVDKSEHDADVKKLAEKLVGEIRGGANFEEVSRQFSHNPDSSSNQPETFWISPDQIDPALAHALNGAKTGTVTDPVRTEEGYRIVKVYATRPVAEDRSGDIEVQLRQINIHLKPDAKAKDSDALAKLSEAVAKNPGACTDQTIPGVDPKLFDVHVDFQREKLSDLPAGTRVVAETLKVGTISPPLPGEDDGIHFTMLCDWKEAPIATDERTRISNMLFAEKINLEAEKYMRDLHRETYIELR